MGQQETNIQQIRFEISIAILSEENPSVDGLFIVQTMCKTDQKLAQQLAVYGVSV